MSRRKQPLPEYGALIRWTVQEVINWLAENALSDCSKCFREGGVDGNKLVNITDTDLINIKCPRKYIKEILNYVSMVARPGVPQRTGGYGNRGNNQRQQPFNDVNHMQDEGSDDDEGWGDEEFSSGYDDDENDSDGSFDGPAGSAPVAPPRPNRRDPPALPRAAAPPPAASHRRLPTPPEPEQEEFYEEPEDTGVPEVRGRPPVSGVRGRPPLPAPDPDGPDEDYENPDANLKVQNFHGGPLPKPPQGKSVPIGQRKPPPLPASTAPAESDESSSDMEEEYEDPDSTVAAKGPPLPTGPRRPPPPPVSSVPKTHHEILAEPSEDYEDPDRTMATKMAQKSPAQRKPRPPPTSSVPTSRSVKKKPLVQEEEYEDPDQTVSTSQKKPQPPPVSKIPPRKTSTHSAELPSYEMPDEESAPPPVPRNVPKRKKNQPKIEPEETYEVPDETDAAPARSVPQRFQKAVPPHEEETYEVPDADEDEEQDDYLEMDPDKVGPPNIQTPVTAGSKNKPDKVPRGKMPLPNESKSGKAERKKVPVPVEPQETYEIPEEDTVQVPQRKKMGIQVLPDMKDLKVSNGVKEGSPTLHSRSGRALPPPPAVSSERVEPVKNEPVKKEPAAPASSVNQPKEMTEADLLRQRWYHGNIKRVDAEVKLKQLSIDGMYLIRKSSQGSDQPYTLQIFYQAKVYNLPIRRRSDNLFAVGKEAKDNERAFTSLLDLVNGFKQNILVLTGGAETKLRKSLPKT